MSPHISTNTKLLHSDTCYSWLAKSIMRLTETWRNMCLIACIPASPKSHICWSSPTLPCLFGAVSQNYLRCCLLDCSPYFAPNKTFNSHIVHLSWQEFKEDFQWDVNKIISIKDDDSGIGSNHSWGSNFLLNQKLTQWEIYHLLLLTNNHSILSDNTSFSEKYIE